MNAFMAQGLQQAAHLQRHVRADKLLPGDEVELDGGAWTISATAVHDDVVRLVLCPGRHEPELERGTHVRVLRGTIR